MLFRWPKGITEASTRGKQEGLSQKERCFEDGRRTRSYRMKVVSEAQNGKEGILPRTFQKE